MNISVVLEVGSNGVTSPAQNPGRAPRSRRDRGRRARLPRGGSRGDPHPHARCGALDTGSVNLGASAPDGWLLDCEIVPQRTGSA
jgi:hypothetical protein